MVAHSLAGYEESENEAGDLASGRIQGDVRAYLNTEQKRRRRRDATVAAGIVVGYIAVAAAYFCAGLERRGRCVLRLRDGHDSRLRRLEWGQRLEHDDVHCCIRTRWSEHDWCGHRRGRGGDSGGSGCKKEGNDRQFKSKTNRIFDSDGYVYVMTEMNGWAHNLKIFCEIIR